MTLASMFTLLSVPLLMVALDRVERRYGPARAGWISGFPIVGGPALLIVTLENDLQFGADAALSALQGIPSWSVFILCFRLGSNHFEHMRTGGLAVISVSLFAWMIVGFGGTALSVPAMLLPLFVAYSLALAFYFGQTPERGRTPTRSVFMMRLCLAPMFVLLTLIGSKLGGDRLAGLLVAFPIVSSTLLVSATLKQGPSATKPMTAGMLMAGPAFSTFLLVLVWSLNGDSAVAVSFMTALLTAGAVHLAVWKVISVRGSTTCRTSICSGEAEQGTAATTGN